MSVSDDNMYTNIGDPMAGDLPEVEKEQSVHNEMREGDSGLGLPDFAPKNARVLSDAEAKKYERMLDEDLRQKFEEQLKELEGAGRGWHIPNCIRRGVSVVMILLGAVLGLFLVTSLVRFIKDIQELPVPWNYSAGVAAGVFAVIILLVIFKLFWMVLSLNRSPKINLKSMKILAERQNLQKYAIEKQGEAKKALEKYLRDYPLLASARAELLAIGLTPSEHEKLVTARERLLDRNRPQSPDKWLGEFKSSFQSVIGIAAKRRVKQYSFRVGVGTAASPIAIVDQMIVLYTCISIVKDLMLLYNLRPAFGQTSVVLSRSIIHVYLSGMVGEAASNAAEGLSETVGEFSGEIGAVLGSGFGKFLSARTTEAALNSFLVWRLGKRAVAMLEPVTS